MEMPFESQQLLRQSMEEELDCSRRKNHWAVILGLKPRRDGNAWLFLWGDDLQNGVAGFGSTPEEALFAFDSAVGQCGGSSVYPKRQ